jgi:hypothetical protein
MGKTELFMMLLAAGWGIVSAIVQKRAKAKKAREQGALGVKSGQRSARMSSPLPKAPGGPGRQIPAARTTPIAAGRTTSSQRPDVPVADLRVGTPAQSGTASPRGAIAQPPAQVRATPSDERLAELRRRAASGRSRSASRATGPQAKPAMPGMPAAKILNTDNAINGPQGLPELPTSEFAAPMNRDQRKQTAGTSIAAMLRNRGSLRDAIVLREILDRPLSERPRASQVG